MPRIPKAKYPFGVTNDYYTSVRAMLLKTHENVLLTWKKQISLMARKDSLAPIRADEDIVNVTILLDKLRETTFQYFFAVEDVEEAAISFVDGVKAFASAGFNQQVQAVLGIAPLSRSEQLNDIAKAAVKENVSYIKSIPSQYHDRLETVILQGLRRGTSTGEIADEIQRTYEVNRDRARFIARDQAGSLMGDITKARHEAQGLEYFIWRTAGDDAVRDSHASWNGERFKWSDGAGSKNLLPGRDYGCRCTAEVDYEELLEFKG